MARTFRLALAQLNLTVGDIPGNTARMLESLHLARESGADLVAFPELATTGYPPKTCSSRSPSLTPTWMPWSGWSPSLAASPSCWAMSVALTLTLSRRERELRNGEVSQLRRRRVRRAADRHLRQDLFCPTTACSTRSATSLRAASARLRNRRRPRRRQRLRGHLVRRRPVGGAAAGGSGVDSQHQRLALPRRQELLPPGQHRRQPGRWSRPVRRLPEHRRRAGRAGLRRQQHDLRPLRARWSARGPAFRGGDDSRRRRR